MKNTYELILFILISGELKRYASRFTDKSYILHQDNFSGVISDIKDLQLDLLNTIESDVKKEAQDYQTDENGDKHYYISIDSLKEKLQLLKDKLKDK